MEVTESTEQESVQASVGGRSRADGSGNHRTGDSRTGHYERADDWRNRRRRVDAEEIGMEPENICRCVQILEEPLPEIRGTCACGTREKVGKEKERIIPGRRVLQI